MAGLTEHECYQCQILSYSQQNIVYGKLSLAVVPLILKALVFDERHVSYSSGKHEFLLLPDRLILYTSAMYPLFHSYLQVS